MSIGDRWPAEWRTFTDSQTGRSIRQYTAADARSYPLYYFIPSITDDGRYLVFHSERTGWVQLYRMDLMTGEITQLTDATSRDSGWAVWCEYHLRGVFNHLSALNTTRREVYYFADENIYCSNLDTLETHLVHSIPGRIPMGQCSFSHDGNLFAFIHADRESFRLSLADREALINMGRPVNVEAWRRTVSDTTLSIIDTTTGKCKTSIDFAYHIHHVLFADNDTLIGCHTPTGTGIWSVSVSGGEPRMLRPEDKHGRINHYVVTAAGIVYETNGVENGEAVVWVGRYDLATDTWHEWRLPPRMGGVHIGNDPKGELFFAENYAPDDHRISAIQLAADGGATLHLLRSLPLSPDGQRHHAHPFLSPDRRRLFYTEVIDGYSQICSLDAEDLVSSLPRGV